MTSLLALRLGLAVMLFPACISITSAFVAKSLLLVPLRPHARSSGSTNCNNWDTALLPQRHSTHATKLTARASSASNNEAINNDLEAHFTSPSVLSWLQKLADSYKVERGEDLLLDVISREDPEVFAAATTTTTTTSNTKEEDYLTQLAVACAKTKLPIASHDFLRDPDKVAIFCYGNQAFIHGFGYEWEEFVQLPSKYCVATEEEMEDRQRILDAAMANAMQSTSKNENGDDEEKDDQAVTTTSYGDDAPLIRVRKDGGRILLTGVNLFNVYDICLDSTDGADAGSSIESIRASIESGEIEAIGQAVWIRDEIRDMD